ncbi:phage tail assembly protein [Candidatus Tokpelaia sp.]|uniref:phage tail assembly protein n=1 Tax=Candidatus Tokpelaia sp. TaxID=2233777 RepID=UPI00123A0F03|nr:phage tail assembly protein [Candidatus Tokpelaia sp.]KAA6405676.1 hypothetical protein DPQ22_03180 [Candidatus Tokpelaia sp.]
MATLKKTIDIELQMPIETEADGQKTELTRLTLHRPTLKQAKDLAAIGGKELVKVITGEMRRGDSELDIERAIEQMADTLLNKDSLDGLTQVLAEMACQKAEVIDRLDWLDIVAVLKAFADFFPKLRPAAPAA